MISDPKVLTKEALPCDGQGCPYKDGTHATSCAAYWRDDVEDAIVKALDVERREQKELRMEFRAAVREHAAIVVEVLERNSLGRENIPPDTALGRALEFFEGKMK